jgi:hypothetical protein
MSYRALAEFVKRHQATLLEIETEIEAVLQLLKVLNVSGECLSLEALHTQRR